MFDFGNANEGQRKAISAAAGPVLITAGPGTGKTYTLVQRTIEQNRCAMACHGCGAVLLYWQLKSSGSTFRNSVLLSYHTKQLNTESPTAYENNSIYRRLPQSEL